MDRVLGALVTDDKCSDELRQAYYLLSKETVHLEDKTVESIVKNIKSLLLSSKTRYQGLSFLSKILGQLSADIFTNNCSVLVQPAIKVLQESKNSDERILAYKVLTQIFAKIYRLDSQNLTRELSNCITPLLTQCFYGNQKWSDLYYAANWLAACATLFPSPVSAKRAFLENKILEAVSTIVDEDCGVDILKALGFAYSRTMLAGNLNVQKYREFLSKLMNTFGQFFNLYSAFGIKKPSTVLQFENDQCINNFYKESSDIFVDPLRNARRLHFLTATICSTITGQYSNSIPLPVEAILECLNTFMLVSNGNIKESHSVDVLTVGYIIPILHDNAFTLLRALLTSCKQNLIAFSQLINRIVISSIEWLDKLKSVEKRLYLNLRSSIYSFLALYFNILGAKSCFSSGELQVITKHLLGSVRILETNITVTTASNNNNGKTTATNFKMNVDKEMVTKSTLNSIRAINRLLGTMGPTLDHSNYSLIQNEVLYTLLQIYRNWFNLAIPYKTEECRRELIESLKLLLQNAPSTYNAALETAIVVFTQAHRIDKSPTIRYLLESCFHLVHFIMDSRIPSSSNGAPPKVASIFESQSCYGELSPSEKQQMPTCLKELSTKCNDNSQREQEEAKDATQIPQKPDFTSTQKEVVTSVSSSDSTALTEKQHGNKRRNSEEQVQAKIAKTTTTNRLSVDSDEIIFDGSFPKSTSSAATANDNNSTQTNLPTLPAVNSITNGTTHLNDNHIMEPLTTTIKLATPTPMPSDHWEKPKPPCEETSVEADEALSYFVVE